MGKILKAKFQVNICGPLVLLLDEKEGFFQSFFGQPMSGRIIKGLLEIAFKADRLLPVRKAKRSNGTLNLKFWLMNASISIFSGALKLKIH